MSTKPGGSCEMGSDGKGGAAVRFRWGPMRAHGDTVGFRQGLHALRCVGINMLVLERNSTSPIIDPFFMYYFLVSQNACADYSYAAMLCKCVWSI